MEDQQKPEFNYFSMVSDWIQTTQNAMNQFAAEMPAGSNRREDEDNGSTDLTKWCSDTMVKWAGWYEKEAGQILKVPPIGIARNYQEDMNQALERFNQLQVILIEFLFLMYQPLEQTFSSIQKDMNQSQLPEDIESLQKKFIKTLETQYLSMFKSESYLDSFSKTIDALNGYTGSRNKVLEDLLRTLPIPNNSDMDELYKEIYELKKRIRMLEKSVYYQTCDE